MADIAVLINRRSIQKGRLTKLKKIVPEGKTRAEIKMRIKQLEDCICQYNAIYDELYALSEYDDAHANEFIQFEEESTALVGKYYEILETLKPTKSDDDPISDKSETISTKDIKAIAARPVDPKIKHFSGIFEEWNTFKEVYMVYIHGKSFMANIEKYVHLRGYLQGEAFELIKNIAFTDDGYEMAWEALCKRYGNKRRIVSHHIDSLLKMSKDNKVTTGKELQAVVDECNNHILSVNAIGIPTHNWDLLVIGMILPRLDNVTREMWESEKVSGELPTWEEMKGFLNSRCRVLEAISAKSTLSHATAVRDKPKLNAAKTHTKSFVTNTLTNTKIQCNLCNKNDHFSSMCAEYLALPDSDKLKKIQSLRLCLNCLRKGHIAKDCRSTKCKKCQRSHNTTLHELYQAQPTPLSVTKDIIQPSSQHTVSDKTNGANQVNTPTSRIFHITSVDKTVLLSTAQVHIIGADKQVHLCRALLDSASENNFITDELSQKLGFIRQQHHHNVSGIDTISVKTKHKVATTIKSRINNYCLNMEFLVIPKITDRLPKHRIQLENMEVPHDVQLADPTFNVPSPVDILIGAQYFFDLLKQQRNKIAKKLPPLHATEFGYIFAGEVDQDSSTSTNFAIMSSRKADDDLHTLVSKLWSLDIVTTKKHLSEEQAECQNHFVSTYTRNSTGRYIVKLPFRNNMHELGESKKIALNRFLSVERRLQRNEEVKLEYAKFIQEYVSLGHMYRIPDDNSFGYYLPHHCIVKPSSTTTKLRVVFDASAKTTSGLALNDILLDGPRTQDDLIDIILRFRLPKYVFSGDIEKMESPHKPIATYELATVTYGVKPAAYLATAVLQQIGIDEGDKFPLGRRALHDFYVDDVMTGDDDIECLINMKNQLCALMSKGGMRLRKFVSNSSRFMDTVPEEDREIGSDLDQLSPNTFIKALGLKWDSSNDKLMCSFHNCCDKRPTTTTKREILSIVASIFDPLGLASPVVIRAKIFLQRLWLQHIPWDEKLSTGLLDQFYEFLDDFSSIQSISINRCVISSQPQMLELHGFADASQAAYGACIYIRAINHNGNIAVNLLCAKSRVAPLKHHTIPRLELCGALLLSRLYDKVINVLDTKFHKTCLWSDSTIVLAWIKTPAYQLKEFVAARVSEIQELTNGISWYHVNTHENIADIISRGCPLKNLAFDNNWWHGPKFLLDSLDHEQYAPNLSKVEVIERKEQQFVLSTQLKCNVIGDLIQRHSSYVKLLRIARYCVRFINQMIKIRNTKLSNKEQISTFDEKTTALYILAHSVQVDAFPEEAKALQSNRSCPRSSSLKALTPFIDKFGIIRVGGRISKSDLPYEQCHQIVLPNMHHFTDVMFRHYHAVGLHSGAQSLLYHTRQIFWTIKGKLAAKRAISICVVCTRQNPTPAQQLMGELPADRVKPHKAFTVVGVDYCGPFMTRVPGTRSKTTLKSYIGVFVCFSTKAIHLEVISDLTTVGFIAALHRFIARRGKPMSIHSDNGTNFVGSSNYLKSLELFFKSNDTRKAMENFSDDHNISWHFIPPRSPHHGGLWEAGVKAVKHHLRRVTSEHPLSFEELSTLAARIECCLNSRPLSVLSDDPNDPQPLTPAHFLIGGPLMPIHEPDITSTHINRLKRWDQIQHMTQSFWKKWSIEYLQSLQKRTKWKSEAANLQVGQVILVHPVQGHPAKWILGLITDVTCGADGFVRVVTVKTKYGLFKRSIHKICPLFKEPPDN